MKENVMLTYKSGQGFDAKLGGQSVRNTVKNVKTAVNVAKDIKNTGIKKTFKKYTSGSNNTTSNLQYLITSVLQLKIINLVHR